MNSSDRFDESTPQDGLLLVEEENSTINGRSLNQANLSQTLPILPLRGLVIYPQTAVPLNIGQPRTIRLLENTHSQNSFIGLCASYNNERILRGHKEIHRATLCMD